MRDHLMGFAPLATWIADAHEPARKPQRTPERPRLSYDQGLMRRIEDERQTAKLGALPVSVAKLRHCAKVFSAPLPPEAPADLPLILGAVYLLKIKSAKTGLVYLDRCAKWLGNGWGAACATVPKAQAETEVSHKLTNRSLCEVSVVQMLEAPTVEPSLQIRIVDDPAQAATELIAGGVYAIEHSGKGNKLNLSHAKWLGDKWSIYGSAEDVAKEEKPSRFLNRPDWEVKVLRHVPREEYQS